MSAYYTATDVVSPNSFMMFPKELLQDKYSHISLDAKVLYSLLLDRVSLSIKNQLVDAAGNVYVVFKQSEVQNILGCAKQKVQKMFKELESNFLIDRKKQGFHLPDLIFVKKLSTEVVDNIVDNSSVSKQRDEFHASKWMKSDTSKGMKIMPLNNTDINNTKKNNTKSIYLHQHEEDLRENDGDTENVKQESVVMQNQTDNGLDGLINNADARNFVCEQIAYDAIAENLDDSESKITLNSIVSLMTEIYSQRYTKIKVNGELRSFSELKSRFKEITQFHVEYVLECLSERSGSAGAIKNLRAYLATALYNAPLTMESYYSSKVLRDTWSNRNLHYAM